jgi:hypothetical protein
MTTAAKVIPLAAARARRGASHRRTPMPDDDRLAALRSTYQRDTGSTPADADCVFEAITTAWCFPLATLPRLVELLASEVHVSPTLIVTWLYVGPCLERSRNGNELLFALGYRAAVRCGVAPELLAALQRHVAREPETRH